MADIQGCGLYARSDRHGRISSDGRASSRMLSRSPEKRNILFRFGSKFMRAHDRSYDIHTQDTWRVYTMMRIGHIEVFVKDALASLPFYRDVLGMEVVAVQREQFVWLESGGVEVLLRPGTPGDRGDHYNQTASAFVLYTDDLAATVETLRSRGLVFRGTDGSPDCLTFTGPDGEWFQLVENGA